MMIQLSDFTAGPTPWAHQEACFDWCADRAFAALALEQRCGKTKVAIGKAVRHYARGEITALLVVAMPGDVHANWVTDELPVHVPPRVRYKALAWRAAKASQKAYQAATEELLSFPGMSVLAVNGEALITETFRRYLGRFLKARGKVMVVADEQTLIMKTPGSKRNKVMQALGSLPHAAFRIIMDGTPVGEGPLDLFAPYQFLKKGLLGHATFSTYKNEFAEYEQKTVYDPKTGKTREYPALVAYRNLDRLNALMAPHTYRVLRRDCFDMPEKIYVPKHRFSLSQEQRRVYDSLKSTFKAEFTDGLPLTATNVLTRYLRLQQVTSNYVPAIDALVFCPACEGDGCEACDGLGALETTVPARKIDERHHPRLETLEQQFEVSAEPTIIWARFRQDVDDVMEMLARIGRTPVRYDGKCSQDQKLEARQAFQAGRASDLVGSARAGGRGLRLTAAQSVHYYSNEFPLLVRLQSEDRAEAEGRTVGTGIHDYEAEDTIDADIIDALRAKRAIADVILNERSPDWIKP